MIASWQGKHPELVDEVESNIGGTSSICRRPRAHHKHMKSTHRLEGLNEEITLRTRVARIFPNKGSWLRLIWRGASKPTRRSSRKTVI